MASNITSKAKSEFDFGQIIQQSQNENDHSLTVNGFLASKAGAKVRITNVQADPAIDDYRFLDVVKTKAASTISASATVTVSNAIKDLSPGQYVFGTGIPDLTTILSVDSDTQITLSANATATGSPSLRFANLLYRIRLEFDDADRTNLVDAERID